MSKRIANFSQSIFEITLCLYKIWAWYLDPFHYEKLKTPKSKVVSIDPEDLILYLDTNACRSLPAPRTCSYGPTLTVNLRQKKKPEQRPRHSGHSFIIINPHERTTESNSWALAFRLGTLRRAHWDWCALDRETFTPLTFWQVRNITHVLCVYIFLFFCQLHSKKFLRVDLWALWENLLRVLCTCNIFIPRQGRADKFGAFSFNKLNSQNCRKSREVRPWRAREKER